jgi:lysozyme
MMKFSDLARHNLTEQFEGCKLVAYRDSKGVLTIGYGHTSHVFEGQTCTQEEADTWLAQDIAVAEAAVNRLVGVKLTQGEFDACVDFAFNVGVGAFANSTLIHLLNEGKYADASNEFEKWDYAGGVVVAGLLRRRLAEKQMFNS